MAFSRIAGHGPQYIWISFALGLCDTRGLLAALGAARTSPYISIQFFLFYLTPGFPISPFLFRPRFLFPFSPTAAFRLPPVAVVCFAYPFFRPLIVPYWLPHVATRLYPFGPLHQSYISLSISARYRVPLSPTLPLSTPLAWSRPGTILKQQWAWWKWTPWSSLLFIMRFSLCAPVYQVYFTFYFLSLLFKSWLCCAEIHFPFFRRADGFDDFIWRGEIRCMKAKTLVVLISWSTVEIDGKLIIITSIVCS